MEGEGRGDRRVKREGVLQRLVDKEIDGSEDESEEEYEEEEDSEDEWKLSQPKKKKKYLCISPRRRKKLDAMLESMNAENDEKVKLKVTGNRKKGLNHIKKEDRESEDLCSVVLKQAKLESVENNLKTETTVEHSIVKSEIKYDVKCEEVSRNMFKAVHEVKQPVEIFNIALVKKELTEEVKLKLPAQIEIKTFAKFNPSESIKQEIPNPSINSKPIQINRYLGVREPDLVHPQYQTQLQGAGGPSHSLYQVPYSSASSVIVQQHLSSPQNISSVQSNQQSQYYMVQQPNEASISNQQQRYNQPPTNNLHFNQMVVGSQSSSSCMVGNGVAQTPSEKNVLVRTVIPQIIKSSSHLTSPPQVTKSNLVISPQFQHFRLASPPQVRQHQSFPQSQPSQTASSFNVRMSNRLTSPAKLRQPCLRSPTQIGLPRSSPSHFRTSRFASPSPVRTSRFTSPSHVGMSRLTTPPHNRSPHQQHLANGSLTPLSGRSQVTLTSTRTLNNTIQPSVARTLFNSPQRPKPVERISSCLVDARMVKLGSSPDGLFSYTVTLPDGTVKSLSSQEIGRIREQNGGYIPREGKICVQLKAPQVSNDIIIID